MPSLLEQRQPPSAQDLLCGTLEEVDDAPVQGIDDRRDDAHTRFQRRRCSERMRAHVVVWLLAMLLAVLATLAAGAEAASDKSSLRASVHAAIAGPDEELTCETPATPSSTAFCKLVYAPSPSSPGAAATVVSQCTCPPGTACTSIFAQLKTVTQFACVATS